MAGARQRRAKWMGKWIVNPPARALFAMGIPVPGTAILETTGRKSGLARQTPVTDGLEDDVFWVVAEHGRQASYMRNIEAEPRVRVKVRRRWRSGTAEIAPDEDPAARLAVMRRRRSAAVNTRVVSAVGTELPVVRIRLQD